MQESFTTDRKETSPFQGAALKADMKFMLKICRTEFRRQVQTTLAKPGNTKEHALCTAVNQEENRNTEILELTNLLHPKIYVFKDTQ